MTKHQKQILSIFTAAALAVMVLPWFGFSPEDMRAGLAADPLAIFSASAVFFGIRSDSLVCMMIGSLSWITSEIFFFLTWHILTITGTFSLPASISGATPFFYLGIALVFIELLLYLFFLTTQKLKV